MMIENGWMVIMRMFIISVSIISTLYGAEIMMIIDVSVVLLLVLYQYQS